MSRRNRVCKDVKAESGLCWINPVQPRAPPVTLQTPKPVFLPLPCPADGRIERENAHTLGQNSGSDAAQPSCFSVKQL